MAAKPNPFVVTLDITGTFIFAVEGALAAIQFQLDLLGVMVLAFCTALGGGIIRDVLIGAVAPSALRDWRYASLAFAGGAVTFLFYHAVVQAPHMMLVAWDAAGLALFTVAGTEKALDYKIPAFIAGLLGTITATGGGVVRDILLAHIPAVLRTDIYATAALFGALIMVCGQKLGLGQRASALCGFAACFVLRMVSVGLHWHLPVLHVEG